MKLSLCLTLLAFLVCSNSTFAQGGPGPGPLAPLPPVPVPAANPMTPAKIILGKILFWDEQLSTDNTVSCGTCHDAAGGFGDSRLLDMPSIHPGPDEVMGTNDDIAASFGVMDEDCSGGSNNGTVFGDKRQVTGRNSPSAAMAAYSPTLFWDGRATSQFLDPETGAVVINTGGALESQAVGPILSSVEMACDSRTWDDVRDKLNSVMPMELALELTPDMANALSGVSTYGELFQAAFGSTDITAARIGMAIASYERTLIPNQTPLDSFIAGNPGALTPQEQQGLQAFGPRCAVCHGGPSFSDNQFHNIGVRPISEDIGRAAITGNPNHNGRFRTPSLRNVKLRAPYFHNGSQETLAGVVDFYNRGGDFHVQQAPQVQNINMNPGQRAAIVAFLTNALTDPRMEQGLPPFDQPVLRRYFMRGDSNGDHEFNIGDVVTSLDFLFGVNISADCEDAFDCNDDGAIDISDPISSLSRLFAGAPPLPAPGDLTFGPDPTSDNLDCGEL